MQRTAAARPARRGVRLGIGDDAALLRPRPGCELVLTTDLFLEDVHFRRRYDPAPVCGRRLAVRALSDLAAMGAEPLALAVSAALPAALPAAWARGLYRGILAAAAEAGASLVGGDSSVPPPGVNKVLLDVIGVGQAPAERALCRSGARPGDSLWVSGTLGLAALGRHLAHAGRAPANALERRALARHRAPRARWELGIALRGRASAAMDISDGLGLDLARLCHASGVGALLCEYNFSAAAGPRGRDLALFGGEDYELLFTLPPRRRPPRGFEVHRIGRICAAPGVWIGPPGARRRLPARGWENWRGR